MYGAVESLGELKRILERVEADVRAVALGGRGDLDLAAQG